MKAIILAFDEQINRQNVNKKIVTSNILALETSFGCAAKALTDDVMKQIDTMQWSLLKNANKHKNHLIDDAGPLVKLVYQKAMVGLNKLKGYATSAIKSAEQTANSFLNFDDELKSELMDTLVGSFRTESWRVRERLLMTFYLMLASKENICPEIVADMSRVLTQRKGLEKNKDVMLLHKNTSWIAEMTDVLKGTWISESEKMKNLVYEK